MATATKTTARKSVSRKTTKAAVTEVAEETPAPATKRTASKRTSRKPVVKVATPEPVKPKRSKAIKQDRIQREVNPATGYVKGTDGDIIASELLAGGASRREIGDRIEKKINLITRNGTEKQVMNLIAGVLRRMQIEGYTVESSFKVLPPTPASKRAAKKKYAAV